MQKLSDAFQIWWESSLLRGLGKHLWTLINLPRFWADPVHYSEPPNPHHFSRRAGKAAMFVIFFGKVCVCVWVSVWRGGGGKRQHCVCYRVEPPPSSLHTTEPSRLLSRRPLLGLVHHLADPGPVWIYDQRQISSTKTEITHPASLSKVIHYLPL